MGKHSQSYLYKGRHRKPTSAGKVTAYCMVGLTLSGTSVVSLMNSIPSYFPPPVSSSRLAAPPPTTLPPRALTSNDAPITPELPATSLSPPPAPDPTPTTVAPPEPTQSATESPVPTSTEAPAPPPEPPPPEPSPAKSEPEPPPDPPEEEKETTKAAPETVEAPKESECAPQSGLGLLDGAALATADIVSQFGFDGALGGRADRSGRSDHPRGLATDFMTSDRELGDAIRDYALANKERLGVKYVIWRQRYYTQPGSGRLMEDRGGDTANHYDHVHISFVDNPGSGFNPSC